MTRTHEILLVEDDGDIRESVKDVLESEGYDVVTAENGREGLAQLVGMAHPCLILLDLMMPVMSGAEFLASMRSDDMLAPIPVVVVSAWPAEAAKVGSQTQGFVSKPISLDDLLATVRRFCEDKDGDRDNRGADA